MMGDDHGRIAAASKLAAKQVGCKVFKGSPYYRKEGARMHCSARFVRTDGSLQLEAPRLPVQEQTVSHLPGRAS